jgi:uncharacterized damage-inducible protein DinB
MEKRDFFSRWRTSRGITADILRAFPEETLGRVIIPGLKPPGELFAHIYVHTNAVMNACITSKLETAEFEQIPAEVDTRNLESLLGYQEKVMSQLLLHASVDGGVWRKEVETPWGSEPMDCLCFDAFAHEMHHRGVLSAMLRILGIDPPGWFRIASP